MVTYQIGKRLNGPKCICAALPMLTAHTILKRQTIEKSNPDTDAHSKFRLQK